MLEDDLLRLVWIADPRISPDGSRIAFTRVHVDPATDEYRTSLWLAETGGGTPRPLTFGNSDSQPRWSPDGRTIAFVRAREPKKPGQIHLLRLDGGEAVAITALEKGGAAPAWSPDGRRIAFLSGTNPALDTPPRDKPKNEPGRVVTRPEFRWNDEGFTDFDHLPHVWVVEARDGATPRQLTHGRFKEDGVAWSDDGRALWFVSDRREEPWYEHEESRVWAVDPDLAEPTDGPALRPVAAIRGPITTIAPGAGGRLLAVGAFAPETPRSYDQRDLLWFEPGERAPRVLTRDHDVEVGDGISSDQHPPRGGGAMPLGFARAGAAALAVIGWQGAARLARFDAQSGVHEPLTPADREVVAGSLTPDGRRAALTLGGFQRPGVLAVLDVESGALRELWDPNAALFAERRLGEIEEIWYPAADGRRIQGWIVKPPDFDPAKKYPLILEIHGGPHAAYGVTFFHEFRVLAAAGYVVLHVNPRGSTTYGQEFANVIQYHYPGDDVGDLLAGVDEVVRRGYVDTERMGVTGGSGGGLLTNWIVTRTDRFACAITQRCVADWASMWWSSDFAMFTPTWFRRAPHEDFEEFRSRSPVYFAERIKTPLMIIHSEEDWRTPIGQGEAMFRALRRQRKPVVMVRFPGESHELSRSGMPSRRVQNQQHIRRWFDHWLMGKPAPEYGSAEAVMAEEVVK